MINRDVMLIANRGALPNALGAKLVVNDVMYSAVVITECVYADLFVIASHARNLGVVCPQIHIKVPMPPKSDMCMPVSAGELLRVESGPGNGRTALPDEFVQRGAFCKAIKLRKAP